MAQFIPRRDETLESDVHQKFLEKGYIDHEKRLVASEAALAKLLAANARGGTQTAIVNAGLRNLRTRFDTATDALAGGLEGDRLGKLSDAEGDYDWVRNFLGGSELSYHYLPADGDSLNLLDEYESKFFEVNITPTVDNEPYTIRFPEALHIALDVGTPMYTFSLNVTGGFSADVTLQGDVPTYYDRPSTYIIDTPYSAGEGTITLASGFSGVWFVMGNISTGVMRAIPLGDDFYDAQYGTPLGVGSTVPTVVATAAAGTGPTVTVTGTSTAGVVELITGTSPTTTGWGELLTFTSGWASGTVPVLALYPANQAAAALTHYGARSGTEAEAHFDLTGIAASTTYRFHYSLLPFAA